VKIKLDEILKTDYLLHTKTKSNNFSYLLILVIDILVKYHLGT